MNASPSREADGSSVSRAHRGRDGERASGMGKGKAPKCPWRFKRP